MHGFVSTLKKKLLVLSKHRIEYPVDKTIFGLVYLEQPFKFKNVLYEECFQCSRYHKDMVICIRTE